MQEHRHGISLGRNNEVEQRQKPFRTRTNYHILQAAPARANSAPWPTESLAAAAVLTLADADPVPVGVVAEVCAAKSLITVLDGLEDALPVMLGAGVAAAPVLNKLAPSTIEAVEKPKNLEISPVIVPFVSSFPPR
jgi:hypothetical protein